jgi:plastocyanin
MSWLVTYGRRSLPAIVLALALGATVVALQQPEVRAINYAYEPATLTVSAGTMVRFVNLDDDVHTISHRGGLFESGLLFKGDSWTYVFNTPGTYEYFCLPHPWMQGTIIVQ